MSKNHSLKSGNPSENSIHKTVIQFVNAHPILRKCVIHIPNEGKRTVMYGKHLKDMGMRPGVADLFIAMPRRGYNGAWIELKSKYGILSEHQANFLNDMSAQNFFTKVCSSVDSALEVIQWYCLTD